VRPALAAVAASVAVGAVVLAGCSASKDEFTTKAEAAIIAGFADDLQVEVTATCEEPGSTAVGSTFLCDALQGDVVVATFVAEITDDNEVVLTQNP